MIIAMILLMILQQSNNQNLIDKKKKELIMGVLAGAVDENRIRHIRKFACYGFNFTRSINNKNVLIIPVGYFDESKI